MIEKKILTFELTPDKDEVEIHCNKAGLESLLATLQKLIKASSDLPKHEHLMTPSWSGNELTEEKQGGGNSLLNKITIRYWPN